MPEIPDEVVGEIIDEGWGNSIRDRTVQRYATVAERSSLHSSPTVGDVAFMEDTGLTYLYYDGAWTPLGVEQTDASSESVGATNLTAAYATYETATLTIPSYWNSWRCAAWVSCVLLTVGATHAVGVRIRIAGVDKQALDGQSNVIGSGPVAVVSNSTGLTATGAVTVLLRAFSDEAADTISDRSIYTLATRLT